MNKGTIKCDVAACKHNNCDNGCCELNEVKISSTCNGDCCKKQKKPSVKVLKKESRGIIEKASMKIGAFVNFKVFFPYFVFFEIPSKT